MEEMVKSEKEIADISALLTEDNKRYVIAVASALLFTQRDGEMEPVQPTFSEVTVS